MLLAVKVWAFYRQVGEMLLLTHSHPDYFFY